MTLQLSFSSETDAQLRPYAAAAGLDVAEFIIQAVEEKLSDRDSQPIAKGSDWSRKLAAAIELHPIVKHIVDDSRETIYAGRGA